MPLAAGRQFDEPLIVYVGQRTRRQFVGDPFVVEACTATLDQPPGLAVAFGQPRTCHQYEGGHPRLQLSARHLDRWKIVSCATIDKSLSGGLGRRFGGLCAMTERGRCIRQDNFGIVQFRAFEFLVAGDFVKRQVSE